MPEFKNDGSTIETTAKAENDYMPFVAQQIKAGRLHLQKVDPVMKKILKQVGPFTAKTTRDRFLTLVRSIVAQQISGAAARTIFSRLDDALGDQKVRPDSLLKFDVDQLREIGISRQKATYILDLAARVDSGEVDLRRLGRMTDEDVVESLVRVKGIGVWTAQMFLMFSLGRLDVFPGADLGIQQAIQKFYGVGDPIDNDELRKIAKPWSPYATIASWYLWRGLDLK